MKTLEKLIAFVAIGFIGCNAEPSLNQDPPNTEPPPVVQPPPPVNGETTYDDHWNPAASTDKGPADIVPVADRDGKVARRMSVAQLEASIPALFGGITWVNGNRANPQVMFNVLSRTLGEPDYIGVTQENRDPSPLFEKFMDDMAGQVCAAAVQRDGQQTDPAQKTVTPYANDVDRNLRWLRLKLHSIYVPDGSMEGLGELKQLYTDLMADTSNANQAWTGVCIAMLTAPEFMAY
jgi:hypothetical protein